MAATKASGNLFALIQWSDLFTSIIDLSNVCSPKKEIGQYEEGEYIEATYQGKVYRAVISHINDDRKKLKGLPLQFTFKKRKSDDDQSNSGVTSSILEEDDSVNNLKTQREMATEILKKRVHYAGSENKELQNIKSKESVGKDQEVRQKEDDSEKEREKPEIQFKVKPKEGAEKEVKQQDRYVTRKEYDEDYKRLKEKIKKLERKMEKLENPSDKVKIIEKTPSQVDEKTRSKEEIKIINEDKWDETDVSSYNGYTIDNLQDSISHFDRLYDAVNCLLLKLFPKEYILSHSVSGKSGNSKLQPKSQFDPRLYCTMLSVIKKKFTLVTTKDITERVHAVQKSLKREKERK